VLITVGPMRLKQSKRLGATKRCAGLVVKIYKTGSLNQRKGTIRYDTKEEINVD